MRRLDLDGRLAAVKVARLSAGQKRRTASACLVARRAELWLLDEPHAGLDAVAGRDELDATLRAAVTAGATVIVASHELERCRQPGHADRRHRRRPGHPQGTGRHQPEEYSSVSVFAVARA